LIVYVFILKVLTNFTKNTSDISCEHTCTQNYSTFIIILYQFVGVWRSYLWHCFVRFGNPRIYMIALFGFKCDWINTDSVAWNMKWYWLIVLYIKVRTVHIYWIYFHTSFKLFQPDNEQWDHITINIRSYRKTPDHIFSSILIIVTSNSRNASKCILFFM
jgi:hypothetical protein